MDHAHVYVTDLHHFSIPVSFLRLSTQFVGVQELLPKYAAQEPAKLAVWGLEEGNRLCALPVMQRPRFQLQNNQQGINMH